MKGRYYITGVQLGVLLGDLKYKIKLLEGIIEKQYLGEGDEIQKKLDKIKESLK